MGRSDGRYFRSVTSSPDDLDCARRLPLGVPKRYCWWWKTLSFDWELSVAAGCDYLARPKPSHWKNIEVPCCRMEAASGADHYEPREPHLEADRFERYRFLRPEVNSDSAGAELSRLPADRCPHVACSKQDTANNGWQQRVLRGRLAGGSGLQTLVEFGSAWAEGYGVGQRPRWAQRKGSIMKITTLGFGFVLLAMLGCSGGHSDTAHVPAPPSPQAPAPQQPAKTPAETIQKIWRDHLRLKSNTAKLDEVVTAGDVLARLCTFKECFESIKDTLRPEERKEAIIYGSMGDLDREGKCWEVDTDRNSIHGSQVGYIDLNGKLVLIRNAPEG